VAILYLPTAQAVHGPPLGPVKPTLQAELIQAALDVLATGEVEPTGHAEHAAEPAVFLNVPEVQVVHAFPAGQIVFVKSGEPSMLWVISLIALSLRNSSTANIPAISP
jgi:hypothetical protein